MPKRTNARVSTARALRKEGRSFREISEIVSKKHGADVVEATIRRWLKDAPKPAQPAAPPAAPASTPVPSPAAASDTSTTLAHRGPPGFVPPVPSSRRALERQVLVEDLEDAASYADVARLRRQLLELDIPELGAWVARGESWFDALLEARAVPAGVLGVLDTPAAIADLALFVTESPEAEPLEDHARAVALLEGALAILVARGAGT